MEKIKGFVVTLEKDISIDDAQPIIEAIKMIKGIIHVETHNSTIDDFMNREIIKHEIREKFIKFYNEELI